MAKFTLKKTLAISQTELYYLSTIELGHAYRLIVAILKNLLEKTIEDIHLIDEAGDLWRYRMKALKHFEDNLKELNNAIKK